MSQLAVNLAGQSQRKSSHCKEAGNNANPRGRIASAFNKHKQASHGSGRQQGSTAEVSSTCKQLLGTKAGPEGMWMGWGRAEARGVMAMERGDGEDKKHVSAQALLGRIRLKRRH